METNQNPPSPDRQWADALGMEFDESKQQPTPPPPVPPTPQAPPPPQPFEEEPPMPATYLIWSILSVIFCCFVPGVIAIVYSSMVSSKYFAKDFEGSYRASENAQIWIIISFVLGLISNTFSIPLMFMQ